MSFAHYYGEGPRHPTSLAHHGQLSFGYDTRSLRCKLEVTLIEALGLIKDSSEILENHP